MPLRSFLGPPPPGGPPIATVSGSSTRAGRDTRTTPARAAAIPAPSKAEGTSPRTSPNSTGTTAPTADRGAAIEIMPRAIDW